MSAFNHTVLSRKKEDFINKFFLSLSMRTRARGSFGSIRHSTNQFSFKPVEWLIGDHVYAPLHHTSIRVRVCYMLCFVFFSVAVIVGAVAVVVSGSRVEIVLYGLTNSINGEVVHTQVVLLILYGSNQFSWLLITVALTVWF